MALNNRAILNELVSLAMQLGVFDKVNQHEPKSAPAYGHQAAIWVDEIRPVPQASGLNISTAQVIFQFRIYQNMLAEPQDEIDPRLTDTVDELFTIVHGNYTLNSEAREVDLLGEYGMPMTAKAGYINQDGKIYRVIDVMIPVVINDVWAQEA